MATPLGCCIDRVIPDELEAAAKTAQAQERGPAGDSPLEIGVVSAKLWKPGRTLRVCFLEGDPRVHLKIAEYARQWTEVANIRFEFVNTLPAEIRISFSQPGYWSALGTDALVRQYFKPDEPTMNYENFSLDTPEEEYSRVVLHEFGHALGCIHEHSSPASGIQWNKPVVYRTLAGPPNFWDKETVDHNVFFKYAKSITQFTAFDPKSIMLYSFPKEWTLNGMEFQTNSMLSKSDKAFMASRYPAAAGV